MKTLANRAFASGQAIKILEDLVAAWRNGEFGNTRGGILSAPSYVQKAVLFLADLDDADQK